MGCRKKNATSEYVTLKTNKVHEKVSRCLNKKNYFESRQTGFTTRCGITSVAVTILATEIASQITNNTS